MTAPRLFLEGPLAEGGQAALDADAARYLTAVMRRTVGAAVRVFNGQDGEFEAVIASAAKSGAKLSIGQRLRPQSVGPSVTLAFAPLKRQATDLVVEKATELGVAALQPVFTQRTVAETVRLDRWAAIAKEAAEQCERLTMPALHAPQSLAAWLAGQKGPVLFADEAGQGVEPLAQALRAEDTSQTLLIGPEGGFDDAERRLLRGQSFVRPISLGPRILRAETACLVGLALIQALWGDVSSPKH